MNYHIFNKIGCYILSLSVFAFSGCSFTYPVADSNTKTTTDDLDYSSMNRQIRNYTVRVTLKDSTEYRVPQFQIGKDSSLIAVEGKPGFFIANRTISSLRIVNHSKGAIVGLLIGSIAGLVVGGLAVPSKKDESSATNNGQSFTIGGIVVLGFTSGLVWGAVKGNQTIFEMK